MENKKQWENAKVMVNELDDQQLDVVERRSQFKRFETVETDYFNALKFVNKTTGIVNKTYVQIMEALGYDIELTYVKRTG